MKILVKGSNKEFKVRFSFVTLLKPSVFENNDPKFSCDVLVPKGDKELVKKLKEVSLKVTEEYWKGKTPAKVKEKQLLKDGDTRTTDDGEPYKGYEGHWYFRASSNGAFPTGAEPIMFEGEKMYPPNIIDRTRRKLTTEEEVYSGMYGAIAITVGAYDRPTNKGITAFINNNIMKTHEGEILGTARVSAEDEFAEILTELDDEFDEDLYEDDI